MKLFQMVRMCMPRGSERWSSLARGGFLTALECVATRSCPTNSDYDRPPIPWSYHGAIFLRFWRRRTWICSLESTARHTRRARRAVYQTVLSLVCEATMAKPIGFGRILEGEVPFQSDMKNSALWNREKIKGLGS